ncbi:hypothetical protein [Aureliella helgolandensis]|uniref:Sulfatase n=1 Tax=Aureliella helgolandensis TaxID=2527968 RepID=A0A518G1X8_9BACT|nr:hypothetical protein [Aureliella helgolandensis]QDV22613.1 hypothetical protein Q31a_08990 [Aureliella helgolandensis]
MKNALAIVVEGVGTGLIGAYGSNTAATPAIDQLAAQGLVLDQCFLDSRQLSTQLRSLWTGLHARQEATSEWSLWRAFEENQRPAALYTDCPVAADIAQQLGCKQVTLISLEPVTEPVEDPAECSLMTVFAAAAEALAEGVDGLVWIHSRGLRLAWDAPLELREKFLDPEDPVPPAEVDAPGFEVDASVDPDWVIGWGQVAAAQTAVLDDAIAALYATVATRPDAAQWSLLFASLGGVPLGEHGYVGWGKEQLHGEELGCAAIILPSEYEPVGQRRGELCQLPDLAVTLMHCLDLEIPLLNRAWGRNMLRLAYSYNATAWDPLHQLAVLFTAEADGLGGQVWVRSPAWSAVFSASAGCDDRSRELRVGELGDSAGDLAEQRDWQADAVPQFVEQLYVKPDDRWEVSDIASRCPEVLQQLRNAVDSFEESLRKHEREHLAALDEELCRTMR